MGCIIMQPAEDKESHQDTKLLIKNGECKFEVTKHGARLQPIGLESRAYTDKERKCH